MLSTTEVDTAEVDLEGRNGFPTESRNGLRVKGGFELLQRVGVVEHAEVVREVEGHRLGVFLGHAPVTITSREGESSEAGGTPYLLDKLAT